MDRIDDRLLLDSEGLLVRGFEALKNSVKRWQRVHDHILSLYAKLAEKQRVIRDLRRQVRELRKDQ